jgi:hypothetical protein
VSGYTVAMVALALIIILNVAWVVSIVAGAA